MEKKKNLTNLTDEELYKMCELVDDSNQLYAERNRRYFGGISRSISKYQSELDYYGCVETD